MSNIDASNFFKIVVAGLIATFVMSATGFWQSGLGLPAMDPAAMLAGNMTAAHPRLPYGLLAGTLMHYSNGVVLALVWVAFLQRLIPSNWIVQGLVYAVLTTLAAVVVVVPLAAGVGIFFSNSQAPAIMLLASTVGHTAYALTLTLALKVAQVEPA